MLKKTILIFFLILLIIVVFFSGSVLGFFCGRGKIVSAWGIKFPLFCLSQKKAELAPTKIEFPEATKNSETTGVIQKVMSSFDNYSSGVSDKYKGLPLLPGVEEQDVWTFLSPTDGIIYDSPLAVSEAASFYRERLGEEGWLEVEKKSDSSSEQNFFSKPFLGNNYLVVAARVSPSEIFPEQLGFKEQTLISLYFLQP
jgi:hypothetical protein